MDFSPAPEPRRDRINRARRGSAYSFLWGLAEKIRGRLAYKVLLGTGGVLAAGLSAWILYLFRALGKNTIEGFGGASVAFGALVFLGTISATALFILYFVNRPVRRLMHGALKIAAGDYTAGVDLDGTDELGRLAAAISQMGRKIAQNQSTLNKQRDEFQKLFELVPCIITVQDRSFRLLRHNREFARKFDPRPGDYCFFAYKGRAEKCVDCPVEKTFRDGLTHTSEEMGVDKDGTPRHWIVRTAPITDEWGRVTAAMEMSLDVSSVKRLEMQLEASEKKYHAIFNNVPSPIFVLDRESLEILDVNDRVEEVYGYSRREIAGHSFLVLFAPEDRDLRSARLKEAGAFTSVRQVARDGRILYCDVLVSPFDYPGREVLLVTTNDVTERIEAEQQLIQASKMATLGEMATGVAHELNQPLTVIKTASGFFMKKIGKGERIEDEILKTLAEEIDGHVDRASRIINHMREFGRKADMALSPLDLNRVIVRAHEIFNQQLTLKRIETVFDLDPELPAIMGDPGLLEQVFVNLFLNARDAIEDRFGSSETAPGEKQIKISSRGENGRVKVEFSDTGAGIPPRIADKVFEPFFTTKKVGEGTGLGLSISYGIVKGCGGTIRVSGEEGRGAVFLLTFPAVQKERA